MKLISLATGLAVGYVLGTRAGHEKYEQIVDGVRKIAAGRGTTRPGTGAGFSAEPAVTPAQARQRPRNGVPIVSGPTGPSVV